MKAVVKGFLRPMLRLPGIGRALQIAQGVWRAPQVSRRLESTEHRLDAIELSGPELQRLLVVLTEVHHRQQVLDSDSANLAKSVPIALRNVQITLNSDRHRLDRMRASIDELSGTFESMQRSVAEIDNRVAHIDARDTNDRVLAIRARVDDHAESITYLLERLEFVRSELLFEFRYGHSEAGERTAAHVPSPTLREGFSLPTGEALRVNLGCGHIPLEGYVNVDNRDLPGVDVVADVENLPFGAASVDEIFSSHFLEHFPDARVRRRLLPYFRSLLRPGASFRAIVPDAAAMMTEYANGGLAYEDLREVLYGGQDYDGDFHFNMFTPESLRSLLHDAGFERVTIIEAGRRNGKSLEFEVVAYEPGDGA